MRTFSAPLTAAMTARYGKPNHLLRINIGTSAAPDTLYWTDAPVTIPFADGVADESGTGTRNYVQQWFVVGDVVTDDQGNQAVDLTFPDINKIVRGLLFNEDWSRRPATLRQIWFDPAIAKPHLDPEAATAGTLILAKGRADGGRPNFEDPSEPVTISIVPDSDAEGTNGPAQEFQDSCRYLATSGYKGIQCGYVGALPSCLGTVADCAAHANSTRYGGSPYAPKPGATMTIVTIGTR